MKKEASVLFLDVDGVLNTSDTKPGGDGVRDCVLRPLNNRAVKFTGVVEIAKVAALARAVEACGAKIVVSSSWRNAFETAGAFATAIGLAPPLATARDHLHRDWRTGWKFSSQRFQEINWWIDDHRPPHFAILDDHAVAPCDWPMFAHVVQTDARRGVTNCDLDRVVGLLGRGEHAGRDWFAEGAAYTGL